MTNYVINKQSYIASAKFNRIPVLAAQMKGVIGVSSALLGFTEQFIVGFADIVKLIRDKNRTVGQLLPLKQAMQMTINGDYFEVKPLSLVDLLQSDVSAHLQEAWRALYAKWKIKCKVPAPWWDCTLIRSEKQKGKVPIYLAPEIAHFDGVSILKKSLNITSKISQKDLVINNDAKGWMFISSSPETPNTCFSIEELKEKRKENRGENRFFMTLNMFMVFFGYCQAMYGSSYDTGRTCFEILFSSKYGKDHPVMVEYSRFDNFKVHRNRLPEGALIGARSIVQYAQSFDFD